MSASKIVVKVGTSTLTAGTPRLSRRRMLGLAQQIVQVREAGSEVILVTSGAMAAGRERLGPVTVAKSLPAKQMLAAVGQTHRRCASQGGLADTSLAGEEQIASRVREKLHDLGPFGFRSG